MISNWTALFTLLGLVHVATASHTVYKSSNRIIFQNGAIPKNIAESFVAMNEDIKETAQFEILNMHTKYHNGSYLCHLPREKEIDLRIPSPGTPTSELKKKAMDIIQKTFSTDNCTFSFNLHDGYWTIAYCFGDKVIQFHESLQHYLSGKHEPHFPMHVYTLGRFPGSEKINKNIKIENQAKGLETKLDETDFTIFDGEYSYFSTNQPDSETNTQKFIKHTLSSGEICDLTMKPRTIDIVYQCDQSVAGPSKLLQFQEIKTCQYQMIIHVPGLCALEEFKRNIIHDNVVDMECKKIDDSRDSDKNISYSDFFSYTETVPVLGLPPTKNVKVNLQDYSLTPCGGGYFLGTKKTESKTGNPYWDRRRIFIYSGIKPQEDLVEEFGRMLLSVLDHKIPSPLVNEKKLELLLSWNDSFTMWYEMYDYTGNFMSLFRVRRGDHKTHSLEVETFDPSVLNGANGMLSKFEAPNNNWNFEHFSRSKFPNIIREPALEAKTQTVTVTVTNSELDVETDESVVSTETTVVRVITEGQKKEIDPKLVQRNIQGVVEVEFEGKNSVEFEEMISELQSAISSAKAQNEELDIGEYLQKNFNVKVVTDTNTDSDSSNSEETEAVVHDEL
ncbi:uncharacterized protein SPAPADRAFT_135526 [Spathaspora passalidarum NRRL Y-27907]|uniref:Endoplasmic reticulum lectin n=1 Tax=Spathaspora passalidarum (strain NRRL Y-27907 / 11-Y1) TaxID=619300 RepID=G3AIM0_SPAPN|nr:uncharacterized protein SPAPADRAFT_135526 [Spathaspora passalidarum NRRL Y-27907]EGW33735.1 hypothetical protein SPAPADRAFT_135526 [Spathaspora passalidarum NRRL Y-27907]